MLMTNSMYVVNIYLGGKLTIQMLKRLKLLSLLKFPNIFHDVFLKSYFQGALMISSSPVLSLISFSTISSFSTMVSSMLAWIRKKRLKIKLIRISKIEDKFLDQASTSISSSSISSSSISGSKTSFSSLVTSSSLLSSLEIQILNRKENRKKCLRS